MLRPGAWLMVSVLLLYWLLSCPLAEAEGRTADERFAEAGRLCEAGAYDRALPLYEALAADTGVSVALYANLAECSWRAGRKGWTALYCERAVHLAPGDEECRARLEQIRQSDGKAGRPFLSRLRLRLAGDERWVWAAVAGLAGVTLAQVAGLRRGASARRVYGLAAAGVALALVVGAGLSLHQRNLHQAVIVSAETPLLLSPFAGAQVVGTLEEGTLVHSGKRHGAFGLIRDEAGRSGWVPESSQELVMQNAGEKQK